MRWKRIILISTIALLLIVGTIFLLYKESSTIINSNSLNPFSSEARKINKISLPRYSESSKEICSNGKCNLILYSGVRFVSEDNTWKPIEKARSLKNSSIRCVVKKATKNDPDVSCLDYNTTSITFEVLNKSQDYPIKVYDSKKTFIKSGDLALRTDTQKRIDYELGDKVHVGENSTTIFLQDADSQNLDDTYIYEGSKTINFGSDTEMNALNRSASNKNILIKFNISSIPQGSIYDDVTLGLYLYVNGLDTGKSFNLSSHHIYSNFTWDESSIDWNSRPLNADYNSQYTDLVNFNSTTPINTFYEWNVTDILRNETSSTNVSFYLIPQDVIGTLTTFNVVRFRTKEWVNASTRPYLNITYSSAPITDTCTPPLSGSWNVTCSDNCKIANATTINGGLNLDSSAGTLTINNTLNLIGGRINKQNSASCKIIINNAQGGKINIR